MPTRRVRWTIGVALVLLARAGYAAGLSPAEAHCQLVVGAGTDRLGAREAACIARCDGEARAGRVPASECVRPFGGRTSACVAAAARLAARHMAGACRRACPACYGGDCGLFTTGAVAATGSVVDRFAGEILCDGAGAGDARSGRCRAAAARVLAKGAVASGRCMVACRRRTLRHPSTAAVCTMPALDQATLSCLAHVDVAVRRLLEARCTNATGCLAANLPGLAERVQTQIVDDYRLIVLCGTP